MWIEKFKIHVTATLASVVSTLFCDHMAAQGLRSCVQERVTDVARIRPTWRRSWMATDHVAGRTERDQAATAQCRADGHETSAHPSHTLNPGKLWRQQAELPTGKVPHAAGVQRYAEVRKGGESIRAAATECIDMNGDEVAAVEHLHWKVTLVNGPFASFLVGWRRERREVGGGGSEKREGGEERAREGKCGRGGRGKGWWRRWVVEMRHRHRDHFVRLRNDKRDRIPDEQRANGDTHQHAPSR